MGRRWQMTTALLLGGTSWGGTIPAAPTGLNAARATLLAADSAYSALAWQSGTVAGLDRMLAAESVVLEPGKPIMRDKPAALAMYRADPAAMQSRRKWRAVRCDVSADGRLGYTYGYAWTSPGPRTDSISAAGKYIAVWRRDARARWVVTAYVHTVQPSVSGVPAAAGFTSPTAEVYPPAGEDSAASAISVAAADRAFADSARGGRVGEAFTRFAAADAAMLSQQPGFVWGRAAIRQAFAGASIELRWHPVLERVAASGDLGFTVGEAEFGAPDAAEVGHSKYLTVWRRGTGGEWRYVVDGGNSRPE